MLIAQVGLGIGEAAAIISSNTRSNIKVAKSQMFNGKASKVLDFLTSCRPYIRMKMRKVMVEKQIQ